MIDNEKTLELSDEKIVEDLKKAVINSFCEMAFLDVQATEPQEIQYKQIACIDITMPIRGIIVVKFKKKKKKLIVEYIHGDDWGNLKPDQIDDCLLELLNVLGGNFLFNLFGEEEHYKVSFPEMVFDETELESLEDFQEVFFDGEGHIFSISVCIEKHAIG